MTWEARKRERTEYYKEYVHKWKLRPCTACNGSGYYDHNGSPPCASCDGTGKERYRAKRIVKMRKYFVVDRYRQFINTDYVRQFLATEKDIKFHTSLEKASHELHEGFYDDSDYDVFSIDEKNRIKRHNRWKNTHL